MWSLASAVINVGCSAAFFTSVYLICYVGWLRPTIEHLFSNVPGGMSPAKLDTNVARLSNHVMSVAHCIIEIPFAIYILRQEEIQRDHLYGATEEGHLCVCIAAGYFLTDVLIMLIRQDEGPLLMMHGVVCFTMYSYGALRYMIHFYGGAFLLWEISTPFVHFRWLLAKTGREGSAVYTANGLAMMVAFFGSRCIWGSYVTVDFWVATNQEIANPKVGGFPIPLVWASRFSNFALLGLCFYWFVLMLRKALFFLNKPKK